MHDSMAFWESFVDRIKVSRFPNVHVSYLLFLCVLGLFALRMSTLGPY